MKKLLEKIRNSRIYIFLNQGEKENLWIYWLGVAIYALIALTLLVQICLHQETLKGGY